ncbi:MAG: alpha/beta hydrolase [Candidatus Hydrogenedentes bacterium]|nr:alpha/beta hydrolase [Candidatus Hydrogenedentota bacterium]
MKKCALTVLVVLALGLSAGAQGILDKVEHGFADNNGVKIHYASLGEGPLVVMIHGFPDFWYTWRSQMEALSPHYRCVAIDQRGYNESDKPKGQENYDMMLLVSDVAAVIKHLGAEKAIVVGHDWGGVVAWMTGIFQPAVVEKLVILNLPHPKCMARELANNPEQQKNSGYARAFQMPDAHKTLNATALAGFVAKDAETKAIYEAAFTKSDFEAMLNYYKQNYPKEPYVENTMEMPNVQAPVLQFHGLKDTALMPGGLNDTWKYLDNTYTLVTVPSAGHWVQHDAPEVINSTLLSWLGTP